MASNHSLTRRVLVWLYTLGAAAYLLYSVITSTGLIGWLEYAQQAVFGGYSMKISILLGMLVLAIPGLLFTAGRDEDPHGPSAVLRRANAPLGPRGLAGLFAGMIAVVWIGGLIARSWYEQRERDDYEAHYQELRLGEPGQTQPGGDHVAVYGVARDDAIVSVSRDSREDHFFVPVVGPQAKPSDPVTYVVKSKTARLDEMVFWENGKPPERRQYPVLARLAGELPVPAAQALAGLGVKLSEPHYLLERIDSVNGKPKPPNAEQIQMVFLFVCGALTFILLIVGVVAVIARARHLQKYPEPAAHER